MKLLKRLTAALAAVLLALAMAIPAAAAGYPLAYEGLRDDADKAAYGLLEAHIEDLKRDKTVFAYYDELGSPTHAKVAFEWDHPELFWTEQLSSANTVEDIHEHRMVYAINNFCYGEGGPRDLAADEAFLQQRVQELCDAARAAGSSRYDQILYIHDWITTHNCYGDNAIMASSAALEEYGEEYNPIWTAPPGTP